MSTVTLTDVNSDLGGDELKLKFDQEEISLKQNGENCAGRALIMDSSQTCTGDMGCGTQTCTDDMGCGRRRGRSSNLSSGLEDLIEELEDMEDDNDDVFLPDEPVPDLQQQVSE